jgi:hypothetical protein
MRIGIITSSIASKPVNRTADARRATDEGLSQGLLNRRFVPAAVVPGA